jgi:DNA-binding HxlR family transcriptional regulator
VVPFRLVVPLGNDYERQNCSLARSLEVVGERWTLLILRDLFFGVRRFTDLQRHLDIPRAVLSARLAALVEQGLVERRPYGGGRDELLLTDSAISLWPALYALIRWGDEHYGVDGGPLRVFAHADCGTNLDRAGRCPACDFEPEPADIVTRPGPGRSARPRTDPVSVALREPHRLLTPLGPRTPAR